MQIRAVSAATSPSPGFGAGSGGPGPQTPNQSAPKPAAETELAQAAPPPAEVKARALLERLQSGRLRPDFKLSIAEDESTGWFVYQTIDGRSGELIRQWPREEILRAAGYLSELEGLLVDERA